MGQVEMIEGPTGLLRTEMYPNGSGHAVGPRGSGKTTWLLEKAVWALGERSGDVIVTSPHRYALEVARDLHGHGLPDIHWMHFDQHLPQRLRGREIAAVLVDDADDIPWSQWEIFLELCPETVLITTVSL